MVILDKVKETEDVSYVFGGWRSDELVLITKEEVPQDKEPPHTI